MKKHTLLLIGIMFVSFMLGYFARSFSSNNNDPIYFVEDKVSPKELVVHVINPPSDLVIMTDNASEVQPNSDGSYHLPGDDLIPVKIISVFQPTTITCLPGGNKNHLEFFFKK